MGKEAKVIWGIAVATIAVIIGGVVFMNKGQNSPAPTSNPDLLIRESSYKIKATNEKVVLVEFGDLQCPACGAYHPLVNKLKIEFKDNLTYVFRNFPLAQHKNARAAAYALEAAGIQGKYWEMQDKLYSTQDTWGEMGDPGNTLLTYAEELKLNLPKFKEDAASVAVKTKVDGDFADGQALGVSSTPTFFVNGVKAPNVKSYEDFAALIRAAILNKEVEISSTEDYHIHYDLKVFVNNKPIDFALAKYQSTHDKELDPDTHVHDGNGKVVHIHKKETTIGQFFRSIGLDIKGRLFVNKREITGDLYNFVPADLDQVVVVSGSATEAQIATMLDAVTNDACIYSLKCPERGTPPPEACVGGLGTGCE